MNERELQQLIEWIVKQPSAVQRLLELYPPHCLVVVGGHHQGTAASLIERDHDYALVVNVGGEPYAVELSDVAVVGFTEGITPEFVRMVCDTREVA